MSQTNHAAPDLDTAPLHRSSARASGSEFLANSSLISTICTAICAVLVIGFIATLGVFAFDIDSNCEQDIHTWGVAAFWLLIAYTTLTLVAAGILWVFNYKAGSVNSAITVGFCVLGIIVFGLYLTAYFWGIVGLFNSSPVAGCAGLYWLDVGLVILTSLIILLIVGGIICLCFITTS